MKMFSSRYHGLLSRASPRHFEQTLPFVRTTVPSVFQFLSQVDSTTLNPDNKRFSHKNSSTRSFKTAAWRKRSLAVKNRLRLATARYRKPGQIQALSMPLSPPEMDNSTLVMLAQLGECIYVVVHQG